MRDPSSLLADHLVGLAQAGHPTEALAKATVEIDAAGAAAHPALHFARAVAYDVLGDHGAAGRCATEGIEPATARGQNGWRAACLAMRALQSIFGADEEPGGFDEAGVMRDLAQAQLALDGATDTLLERIAAFCNLAEAYSRLRLYELAVSMYLETAPTAPGDDTLPTEAKVVQQLNLAALHLTWALELTDVGLDEDAAAHCAQALVHALDAERSAAGPHRETWAERARLFAGCAQSQGPDPLAGADQVRLSLAALDPIGADYERALAAPLLGLALAAAGRHADGLVIVDAALAAAGPTADPTVLAATQRARLVLLAATSVGARAGLDLGRTLSGALWRQRVRRLSAAEALLRFERLQVEHADLSRDADVDALTGTVARRALDRRMAVLEGQDTAAVCVLVIDLDKFKQINDTVGHQAGDDVLRAVGHALRGALRGDDIVGRFGGDEFVAILSTEAADGLAVAERMLTAVRALVWPDTFSVRPRLSIGLAVTHPTRTLHQTLATADEAMYRAKRSGGDTVMT